MKLPDGTDPDAFDAFLDSRELCEEPHPTRPGLRCAMAKDEHAPDHHEALAGPGFRDAYTWPIASAPPED